MSIDWQADGKLLDIEKEEQWQNDCQKYTKLMSRMYVIFEIPVDAHKIIKKPFKVYKKSAQEQFGFV